MANSEQLDILNILLVKLEDIIIRLEHIEQRQIKTTAMVEDVQEHETPQVGSFGTTNHKKL